MPSLSVLSPVCCGARTGAGTAPVDGVFEETGADRVDSVGVVSTDWPSQNMQGRSTKRYSLCVIRRKEGRQDFGPKKQMRLDYRGSRPFSQSRA